jgi:hypothetical protein
MARGQLGEEESTEEADRPAEDPGDEGEAGPAQERRHGAGRAEDSRADHDPHHDRQAVERAQAAPVGASEQ